MQNQMILFFFLIFSLGINAQNSIQDLEENHNAKISYHQITGVPSFIRFQNENPMELAGNSLEEKANDFFENFGVIFGIQNYEEEVILREIREDVAGGQHFIFNQYYDNVIVFGGDIRLHFNNAGDLTAVNGVFIPDLNISSIPNISESLANQIALETIKSQRENISEPLSIFENKLTIFRKGLAEGYVSQNYLAYEIEVRNGHEIREFVIVDAQKGAVIQQYQGMCEAINRRLYQTNTNAANIIWDEGDPFPGSLNSNQQDIVDVSGQTYYLFFNTFGFDSYDGNGALMRAVHNAALGNCPNANWNGFSTNYCSGVDSDDIVGHEWGHAYTQFTSNLIYAWQSGALNESYSDIWGEVIDLLNTNGNDTGDGNMRTACSNAQLRWQMGEDATGFGASIRDMWDPTCDGDPGKVTDAQYHCASSDNGGVHSNSGVNNHAFSLLVDGGTYNGRTIIAIGMTKAAHIFWSAQHDYLTRTSDFYAQADALEAAANAFIGIDLEGLSISATPTGLSGEMFDASDVQQVVEANLAVEFRTNNNCGFTPMLDPNTPDACSPTFTQIDIFFDDFESGLSNWTITQIPTNPATWDAREWELNSSLPKGRAGTGVYGPDPFVGNCAADLDNGIIRMESPVIATTPTISNDILMSFDHFVSMENNWDGGNLKYSLNSGAWTVMPSSAFTFNGYNKSLNTSGQGNDNPMEGEEAFTGADGGSVSGSWGQSQLDLSQIGMTPGDNIQLRFELGTDGCNGWDGWYLDDVRVYYCFSAALPVELVDFRATPSEKSIELNWQTATEQNNLGFEILRSTDPFRNFETIGIVQGKGNSQTLQVYNYRDFSALSNILYYYRLRQIDFDGNTQYSKIESAKIESASGLTLTISPNPASNFVQLLIQNSDKQDFEISIIDLNGKEIFLKKPEAGSNLKSINLDLSLFERGFYFIKLQNAHNQLIEKVVLD